MGKSKSFHMNRRSSCPGNGHDTHAVTVGKSIDAEIKTIGHVLQKISAIASYVQFLLGEVVQSCAISCWGLIPGTVKEEVNAYQKYETPTIYSAYLWYAVKSYQIWYVMHTIDLGAT